jgi:hypothetical protein
MASTRADEEPAPSGIDLPPGVNWSRGWSWFRVTRSRHRALRVGVFVVGLLLVLAGAAAWLVSALLSLPAVFLGLWVWSREFHWGHRLFKGFLRHARSLWSRVKARPLRWALITIAGVGSAWGAYWALQHLYLRGMG